MKNILIGILLLSCSLSGYPQTKPFTAGTIGTAQTICYNTAPAALTQLTAPTGGSGSYKYQWQRSTNNSSWSNISGATLSGYAPPVLVANTWYRRRVTSGTYGTLSTNTILITVYGNLNAPKIGTAQTICYNSVPAALTQLTVPTGGTGTYTYQWQSSANNSTWTNISGATSVGYASLSLTANTYFRCQATSGSCGTVNSASILISINAQITLAQLHDNLTIDNNTSTNINVIITGGTSPYTINYTRNGIAQPALNNYTSGTSIPTGVLTSGIYTYALTSVTDSRGCIARAPAQILLLQ